MDAHRVDLETWHIRKTNENEHLVAKIGVGPSENEPSKVSLSWLWSERV